MYGEHSVSTTLLFLPAADLTESVTMTYCIGFDPELLAFVPRPVAAIIFLYPITEISEQHRHEEEAKLTKREQDISPNVMFFKQTISNACGTIALLHSVANNPELMGKLYMSSWICYLMWYLTTASSDFRTWIIQGSYRESKEFDTWRTRRTLGELWGASVCACDRCSRGTDSSTESRRRNQSTFCVLRWSRPPFVRVGRP